MLCDRPGATAILERSEQRDRYGRRILAAWREGWRACEVAHTDDYEVGFSAGRLALKRAQHEAVELTELEIRRWGPGGRGHFTDPWPGDYLGGPLPLEMPGKIWLARPSVH